MIAFAAPAAAELPEPIAYYPLDGSAEEATGNNIDLFATGDPSFVPATAAGLGQTLDLDGVDDALLGTGYIPSSTGKLTLSAWVRAETRAQWGSIFKNWNGQFHFGIDNGLAGTGSSGKLSNYINLDGVGGQPYVVAPDLFPVGIWVHAAVVVDSSTQTQKLYMDGVLIATGTFTDTLRNNPCAGLGIGAKPSCDGTTTAGPAGFWHGQIDEVAAWDEALTDSQIDELYNRASSGRRLWVEEPPTPIAYYPLDGSGQEATGNNIDLDPIGNPSYASSLAAGLGQALRVDGIDDALIGAGYTPSSTGQLTLSAWVRAETRANWGSIFKNWSGQFHFGIDGGLAGSGTSGKLSNYINLDGVGGQPSVAAPDLLPVGEWTHTAVVVDSGTQTQSLFINGAFVASNTFSGSLRTDPCTGLGIGVKPRCDGTDADIGNVPGFWHGDLDEVIAWDVALSGEQISEIYSRGASGIPLIDLNQRPVANAGFSLETAVGEYVEISGLGSTDDTTAPVDLTYAWTLTSQPSGSTAVLSGAGNSVATLRPDMPGEYTVQLVVSDEDGAVSEPAEMQVGADIEPSFVFELIFEGYATFYRDASGYESSYERLYPMDAKEGRGLFLKNSGTSEGSFLDNTRSYDSSQSIDEFNEGGFTTRFTATHPMATTPYSSFYNARYTEDDQFRFLALPSELAPSYSSYYYYGALFETTMDGARVIDVPTNVDGYDLYPYGWWWYYEEELFWVWGYGNTCVKTRDYVYPDGRVYTYCSTYSEAVFELTSDGPVRALDNVNLSPPNGGVFSWFERVERTPEGDVLFVASTYDESDQYRRGLFRHSGGETAELVIPYGIVSDEEAVGSVDGFATVDGRLLFSASYRIGDYSDSGVFELRNGVVTPVYTYRTSPIRLSTWFQTNGSAFATYGWLRVDSDGSESGVWWLEQGTLKKVASRNDPINGVTYDSLNSSVNRPVSDTFDDRSVILQGYRRLVYENNPTTGIYAGDSDYDTIIARFDTDRDGRGDDVDNCPLRPNEDQTDSDGNGIGDVCEDSDADSVPDVEDNCPLDPNLNQLNTDGDAYGNACDLCPDLDAESQADRDEDGIGDLCDPDIDDDGYDNEFDNCPVVFNDQADLDDDFSGDVCDPDIDGDGIENPVDGRIVDGAFVDDSELASSEFTDFDLGGVTFGRIINSGGLEFRIFDSPDSTQGLRAQTLSGAGQLRIKPCDLKGPPTTVDLMPDSESPIDCGSIKIAPTRGHAFFLIDDAVLVHAPAGTKAQLLDTDTREIMLSSEAISGQPVTMVIDEDTEVIMEGNTLVHAEPDVAGQYVIENDATSLNPITVVSNGIAIDYAPGDLGLLVAIDIKPGSDDNTINLGSNGVVSVAILSAADFDATDVDPLTVRLASSEVRLRGRGTPATQINDVNNDGIDDLVVQVETENLVLQATDSSAKLTGTTYAGTAFIGEDLVTIVPDN